MVTGTDKQGCIPSCYFSIFTHNHYNNQLSDSHYSVETPGFNTPASLSPSEAPYPYPYPGNPLLAQREATARPTLRSSTMSAANFLQLQTNAAHPGAPARPRPKPTQDVLHVSSDDSTSSDRSSSSSLASSLETARCSRCQRTPSIDIHTGTSNMVSYGLNLYYCRRCASIVGLFNG